MDEDLTAEQQIEILSKLASTTPTPEEKRNAHTFLHAVATEADTTKVGNLREEEVGVPVLSQRTLKELELYSRNIAEEEDWADYFKAKSEILTSTSLSKDAKLLELAVVSRREVADVTPKRQINTGWFKKKKQPTEM